MSGPVRLAGRVQARAGLLDVLTGRADVAGVLVTGEAGIGKSRLVAAASADARDAGVTVLGGWCLPLSAGLPMLPVLDVLAGLADLDDGGVLKAAVADCPPYVKAEIDTLLGRELPGSTGGPTSRSGPAPASVDGDPWVRQRRFEAVRRVLEAAAGQIPLAITVEDAHWADQTSLDLIEYLLAPGRATTVRVVTTVRTAGAARPELIDWTRRLTRDHVRLLRLPPLSQSETAEQVSQLLGSAAAPAQVAAVHARSEGNPFFTEQLLAHARGERSGRSTLTQPAALPRDLAELLMERVGSLALVERDLVDVLAVAARPLDETQLSRISAAELPAVRSALHGLIDRALVRVEGDDGYQLTHALLGEAVTADMLAGVRRHRHAGLADLLIATGPELAAEAAEHYAAAGQGDRELPARLAAAQWADSRGAAADALVHWQRAIDLMTGPPPQAFPVGTSAIDVYGSAFEAARLAQQRDVAAGIAADGYRVLFDTASLSDQAVLHARLGSLGTHDVTDEDVAHLMYAISVWDRLSPCVEQVVALSVLEMIERQQGHYAAGLAHVEHGLTLAAQLGLRAERLLLLTNLAWHQAAQGRSDQAADTLAAVERDLRADDPLRIRAIVAIHHTDLVLKHGPLETAHSIAVPVLDDLADRGLAATMFASVLRGNVCEALLELGRTDDAAATASGPRNGPDYAIHAELSLRRGDLAAAARFWDAVPIGPGTPLAWLLDYAPQRMELLLWSGEPETAVRLAVELLAQAAATDESGSCAPVLALAMRAAADLAATARARLDEVSLARTLAYADQLRELCADMKNYPFGSTLLTVAAPAHGQCWDAEHARLVGAETATTWAAAADEWDRLQRPHRAAYARWRQAEHDLADSGRRADATDVLRSAARQATGHQPLRNQIADLARRARVELQPQTAENAPPNAPNPGGRTYGLTGRELAVLRLIAAGKTNPEIGRELFISPKTASVHVSNILRKLGTTSRTHAATIAHHAGLLAHALSNTDKGSSEP